MNKNDVKALQKRYGMRILREPVTGEAWGLYVESRRLLPELDALADGDGTAVLPCACIRERRGPVGYAYKLICPPKWFDLFGWKD